MDRKRDFINCRITEIEQEIGNITKERLKAPSVEIMNPLKLMKNICIILEDFKRKVK